MTIQHRTRRRLSCALCILASCCFLYANSLELKALLAQTLIERAWSTMLILQQADEKTPKVEKPWHWADFWPVAKLQIKDYSPLFVLSGSNGQALAFGPGHLPESTAPGETGQVIVAGHKDSHFSDLEHVQIGDILRLENVQGLTRQYRIDDKTVVNSERQALHLSEKDELILITCYPFNTLELNSPLRLVIKASPI